ncbi:amino acid permease/ SLC12A domain-containing protein [Chaetomium fimeti]|jgi:amino acid transporter|uniref:Amino acid permease/ SLC12A domain-containing protein n=1 Tax=Chaetomium fimeti TaxID=1854472 RepID=A0AAE0LUC3_9PEZI|nr:amino acid permease/ SLC12A domain-containing protein [Chaetomium fimeti]
MSSDEKVDVGSHSPEKETAPPAFSAVAHGEVRPRDEEDFLTRNGLNLRSFQKRDIGGGSIDSLDRSMSTRHMHMISIGGSIGAGFFVGSGKALADGGPGSLFIDFLIIGVMMFNTVYALGELAVMYPVSGGFYTYSTRFIDPSWGFAMGWNYVMQWAVVLPLELTVCAMTIQYWNKEISVAVWITVFLVAILFINIFGALGYAEEEFWSSVLKLAAIIIFMITAFVLVLGGGPEGSAYDEYVGARTWYDPGAFANGFRGFCSVFVTAAFSFSGTELVGLAAAEAKNPLKSLPGAIKQVFWRITLFYILGLFFVGLLIPHNDTSLLGNPDVAYADVAASPFVLVGKYANLNGYDSFMNVIILVSVLSIGVSAVYGGSRTLTALAQQGYAPRIFSYIDRSGRPLVSVLFICVFAPLAYVNLDTEGPVVFDWLLALSGLAALFTWGSICLAHIRFRTAWRQQGHTLDEIPFRALGGVYGSYIGLGLNILCLIAQLYVSICPVKGGFNDAEGFFKSYLAMPVVIVFWIGGFLWKRTGWLRTDQIDLDTGRRDLDWDAIHADRAKVAAMPSWKRTFYTLFV